MKDIVVLMFSMDRAMQCDAALRSLKLNCVDLEEADVKVICFVTTDRHDESYFQMVEDHEHQGILFIQQSPIAFEHNVLNALKGYSHVLFLVDDNIFTKKFHLEYAKISLRDNSNILTFSYRLGKNINFCYPLSVMQSVPSMNLHMIELCEPCLVHNWKNAQLDWNYPMDVSSSMHRVSIIEEIIDALPYPIKNPNELEYYLDMCKGLYADKYPYLAYYEQSIAFCNPMNKVNPQNRNRSGDNKDLTIENLLNLFEQGYRINVEKYVGFIPNSCHQEVNVEFER